jgi:patatin-like phospholipase/acyl hydrolase
MKKVRILSIDGGGIRGIIPATILNYIEQQLQKREGKDKRLADYFELIAGTSTGGILACAYLLGDKNKRPKMTAKEALDLYLTRGEKIFDLSFFQRLRSAGGLTDEKYSVEELENALEEYFGEAMLRDFVKPSMITAYDFRNRQAKFFTSAEADSKIQNFRIVDVARATSAAPTYFEPVQVKSELGTPYSLVDGGVFANNPAMCAYSEARNMDFKEVFKDEEMPVEPSAKDMIILSLGTGSVKLPYHYDKMKDKGQLGWIKPIIDILMSSNSETVHYQLLQVFNSLEEEQLRNNYYRLEPSLFNADSDMDNASRRNLKDLHEAGLFFIDKNADLLDEIIEKLIENG